MTRKLLSMLALLTLVLGISVTQSRSAEGVLEINQACAVGPGCFPGDDPGLPVVITNSGSYRLTSNLIQVSKDLPVVVMGSIFSPVDSVTLDLNGFAITGDTVCTQSGTVPPTAVSCTNPGIAAGIFAAGTNIAIFNGTVRGIGSDGIHIEDGMHFRIERVKAFSNYGTGIKVYGVDVNITECMLSLNGGTGIDAASGSGLGNIKGNFAEGNGGNGIYVGQGAILDNVVANNVGVGIACDGACTVSRNASNSNGSDGIYVTNGSVVGNTARYNYGFGLHLEVGCAATCSVGYVQNIVISPSGGTINTVSGGVQMGQNICNGDTVCP